LGAEGAEAVGSIEDGDNAALRAMHPAAAIVHAQSCLSNQAPEMRCPAHAAGGSRQNG